MSYGGNSGLENGLVPYGNNLLFELMLTNFQYGNDQHIYPLYDNYQLNTTSASPRV